MDIGLVLDQNSSLSVGDAVVSILILVDIGLVLHFLSYLLQHECLNPYSCGYRTGTRIGRVKALQRILSLNPYSCGYRTGTNWS